MKIATRFYIAVATLLVTTFLLAQHFTIAQIGRTARAEAAFDLEQAALLTTHLLGDRPFDDALADSLGAAQQLRVTLIGHDGRVLGDSEVPAARLSDVENHGGRPEVRAALEGRAGTAGRPSETVARSLLYVAVPSPNGALRLSTRLDRVTGTTTRLRQLLVMVLIGGLLAAYPLSHFAARPLSRRLGTVEATVKELAGGDLRARTGMRGGDRTASLGRAIDVLASGLEEQAGRSDERTSDLRTLFDSLDEGVGFVDSDGQLQMRNSAFERWAGRAMPVGSRVGGVFRSPEIVSAVERAQLGESTTQEVRLGDDVVLVSVRPHRGGALLILRDLTNLRRLEGMRRDFVANMSHELKTPLTSIVGFAEAMSAGGLPPDTAEEFAQRILANSSRMRRLVDDLLDLSLIESGSWSPILEPVRLDAATRETWDEFSADMSAEGVELHIDDPERAVVHADPHAVRQILRNLIGNAIRYAPEDSAIEVSMRPHGAFVRTEVRDRGPGITSAHLERVFERFYRVDPGRSREEGGTGLGLAIVKHLVVAHGGDVGLDSEVSQGTTAWFTLPVATDNLVDAAIT